MKAELEEIEVRAVLELSLDTGGFAFCAGIAFWLARNRVLFRWLEAVVVCGKKLESYAERVCNSRLCFR